ncbi:hypothetical protein D3C78_894200 [compost metagenome]
MNSCLYECLVMHNRLEPRRNRFYYRIFMFYLDLDEIDSIAQKRLLFSHNKFNIFNFKDSDHLEFQSPAIVKGRTVKENIAAYFEENGIAVGDQRIMLLTSVCTMGYQFNPVSFYYLIDEYNDPVCALVQVGNAYEEQKPYFIGKENLRGHRFYLDTPKYFDVSPFIDHNVNFHFNLEVPSKKFSIKIDDQNNEGKKFFVTTLIGSKRKLSAFNLVWMSIKHPFVTLKVVTLIHLQGLKLWLLGTPYHKKEEYPELLREAYKPYRP